MTFCVSFCRATGVVGILVHFTTFNFALLIRSGEKANYAILFVLFVENEAEKCENRKKKNNTE